jgi:hypothetical protein
MEGYKFIAVQVTNEMLQEGAQAYPIVTLEQRYGRSQTVHGNSHIWHRTSLEIFRHSPILVTN